MPSTIAEIMTANPQALPATASLDEAARCMRESDIGDVLVLDQDDAVCGVVTDRDIVVRSVADGQDPTSARLGDICTRDLLSLRSDDSVERAVEMMRDNAIRRLPVVDDGRPVGIVSLGDLAIERDRKSALADISKAPANN